METLFQACFVIGAVVLVAQILLNLVGIGASSLDAAIPATTGLGDAELDLELDEPGTSDALNLLSVRAVSAGVAAYGASGLAFASLMPEWAAAMLAVVPALALMVGTAWATRQMLKMDTSGTLQLTGAIGLPGTVYLKIPGSSYDTSAYGLVHVALQGRTTELKAVTRGEDDLASGSEIVVISFLDDGSTAEVVPPETFEEMLHGDSD